MYEPDQVQFSALIWNKLQSVAFPPDLRLEKLHNCSVQDVQGCRGLWGPSPVPGGESSEIILA